MEVKVSPLALGESSYVYDSSCFDAHALQGRYVRDRGNDEVTGIFEADEAPIKQVIDGWSQEQSILSVEALIVRRITPRLAMAGYEMDWVLPL